jgi:hypothetical protein
VVLCQLINRIKPQTIRRINSLQMPFPQRENIKAFCDAARHMGFMPPLGQSQDRCGALRRAAA